MSDNTLDELEVLARLTKTSDSAWSRAMVVNPDTVIGLVERLRKAEVAARGERMAVVAWLRSKEWRVERFCGACRKPRVYTEQTWRDAGGEMREVADAIERGEHIDE